MENKCIACLSDRRLVVIDEIQHLLKEICFTELQVPNSGVCWECNSKIIKFHKFKTKTLKVLASLSHRVKSKNLKPLSTLVMKTNIVYDYEYNFDIDTFIDCNTEPECELELIKEESNVLNDNDEDVQGTKEKVINKIENVYMESFNELNEIKTVNYTEINQEEFAQKFTNVIFSEEEILKNREEKRNRYNYKKLPFKCDRCVLGFTREQTYKMHLKKKHNEATPSKSKPLPKSNFLIITPFKKISTCGRDERNEETANDDRSKMEATLIDDVKMEDVDSSVTLNDFSDSNVDVEHNVYSSDSEDDVPLRMIKNGEERKIEGNNVSKRKKRDFSEKRGNKVTVPNKTENVFVKNITEVNKTETVNNPEIDEEEFAQKFTKVIFSEEEMLKNREEKRNHYNYKKLPFKCDHCVLGFTREQTYDMHLKQKHDEVGPHTCDVCNRRFKLPSIALSHRSRHYVCYKCKLCKYDTTERWCAVSHCRARHARDVADRIHCGQCDDVFKSPLELERHVQSDHTLRCNECRVTFKGKDTLRRHKARIHAFKRDFICEICSKTFINKSRLESHMSSHGDIAQKLAYCHLCKVQYKNIQVLRSHLRNSPQHSERMYPCKECNKKFASKVYWNKHYNFYHLRKSRYQCDVCKKLFISKWRLINHKQKHHGLSRPRNYACTICGKKFFTMSMLRNHQLTHSEQRSYMCEDCGDTFKQRAALYTHSRLVHSGKTH